MTETGGAGPTRTAVGARLYTRAPVTIPWVARSVAPVARALGAEGALVQLRRGWRFGPHVDVLARGPGRPLDWARIAAGLDAGPAPADGGLGEAAYLDQARELGRTEAVPPPYLPMRGHGTVELLHAADVASAQPQLDGVRDVVSAALCRPLLAAVDELAEHPARGPERLAEAFLALADTHVLGVGHGTFSLRSHVEAFLAWTAPRRDLRPVFAQRLARDAAALRPLVEQRLAGAPGPAAAGWRTAFGYAAGVLDSAVAAGTLTAQALDAFTSGLDTARMGPPGAPDAGPRGAGPDSAFHRAVDASGVVAEPPAFFSSYRMLVNLFYRQLPLLTVSPLQRCYTCYAVAETVDEVLGETWQERLHRVAGAA
jgi:hypothetical protein